MNNHARVSNNHRNNFKIPNPKPQIPDNCGVLDM